MVNMLMIIFIPYVQSLQTAVHHQFPGIAWNAARDICKPFGLENRHDYLQASFTRDEKEFWIGKAIYKEPTPWIEIIGCYQIGETFVNPFHTVESIGLCKHKCDSEHMGSYFGYRKKTQRNCVCQPRFINQVFQSRIDSCDSSENFFVYKEYYEKVNMSSEPGHCTTICCGLCNLPTHNINHLEGRRCSSRNKSIVGRCGKQDQQWGLDYFQSINVCIKSNRLLPTSNYCQGKGRNSGQMSWTNVFREEVEIIKLKDFHEDPLRCFSGKFILVNGQRKLNVSDHRCSKHINWFICKTNSSVTESATQSMLSTIDNSKGKQTNISPGQSLSPAKDETSHRSTGTVKPATVTQRLLLTLNISKDIQTHTSSSPSFTSLNHQSSSTALNTIKKTGFTNDQRDNEDKSTTIGAMIGGVLGACCILFVSAVLIVCKIRSKGIFKETTHYVKEHTHQAHFTNSINQDSDNTSDRTSAVPLSNQTYGLDGASAPVYAVVNKLKKLEKIDENYTDAGYGEYDHLHDIHNRKTCPQENIYDSHGAPRNEEDQTYDSSDFGNRISNDDVYDHSFSVVVGNFMSNENHDSHNHNNTNIYDKAS